MKKETFWKARYQLPNGRWQGWTTYESFAEAEDTITFHAKNRPYEILRQHEIDLSGNITPDQFQDLLDKNGLTKYTFALHTGVGQDLLSKAKKRDKFSTPMIALIRCYFSTI